MAHGELDGPGVAAGPAPPTPPDLDAVFKGLAGTKQLQRDRALQQLQAWLNGQSGGWEAARGGACLGCVSRLRAWGDCLGFNSFCLCRCPGGGLGGCGGPGNWPALFGAVGGEAGGPHGSKGDRGRVFGWGGVWVAYINGSNICPISAYPVHISKTIYLVLLCHISYM